MRYHEVSGTVVAESLKNILGTTHYIRQQNSLKAIRLHMLLVKETLYYLFLLF